MKLKLFRIDKKINRNAMASGMYAIANVVSKGIVFLTVPVFTRILSTSEMGVATTFTSLCSLLFPIMTMAVTAGTMQIGMSEYKDMRDEYSAETLIISSTTTVLLGAVLFLFRDILFRFCNIDLTLLIIMVLYAFFYAAIDIWYTRARFEHRYVAYTVVSLGIALLSTAVSIFAVAFYSGKTNLGEVRVVSQYSLVVLVSMFFYFYILLKGKFFFDKSICRKILAVSWPLVFHTLSKNILDVSDRLMVAYFCGSADAGIYGIISGFSVIVVILWNSIDVAIVPSIFDELGNNNFEGAKQTAENALYVYLFIISVSVVIMPLLARIMTVEQYVEGFFLIPVLLLGNFFLAIYHIFGTFLLYRERTKFIMYGTVFAAVSNVLLNVFMLSRFGYFAAAFTTVIAFALQAVLQGMLCYKEYGFNIMKTRNIVGMSSVCFVICWIGACLKYNNPLRVLILVLPIIMIRKVMSIVVKPKA